MTKVDFKGSAFNGVQGQSPWPSLIDPDEFGRWMACHAPWRADRRVAVAVSGGADSLCLAWLAARWGSPTALVVDHGLRAASGAEAALTLRRLAGIGVPARRLRLRGLAAGAGLAARARGARYAALLEACAGLGLTDLLLGHHRDDQAETVLMRRRRPAGSGAGLAGMSAIGFADQARLVRPLLHQPGARLRATLAAAGLGWVEDPSNAAPAAERSRARACLAGEPGAAAGLLGLAAAQAGRRIRREQQAAEWLAAHAVLRAEGFALIPAAPLPQAALAGLLRVLAGEAYAPAATAVRELARDPRPATLGGVRLMPAGRLGSGLLMVREAAAMAPPVVARPGACWDGRFRLLADHLPSGLHLGALGGDAAGWRGVSALPAAVLRSLPAIRDEVSVVAVPQIGYHGDRGLDAVRLCFAPPSPVAGSLFAGFAPAFVEGVPNGMRHPTSWLEDEPDFCPDDGSGGVVLDGIGC